MIIEKLTGVSGGYYNYNFKVEILNQEITVGELRTSINPDKAYLSICFPENNNDPIKINTKDDYLDEVIKKAQKIVSKKMYLLAEQILCSLKETKKE